MLKRVCLVRRRPGLSLAQFQSQWLDRRGAMELRAFNSGSMLKIVVSFSTGEVVLGGTEAPFDAMVAGYFDGEEDARAGGFDPIAAMIRDDLGTLVEVSRAAEGITAEEHLMAERPDAARLLHKAGQLKVVRIVYRRRDLTSAQFKEYWLQNHSRLKGNAIGSPGVQRIVASFAIPEAGRNPDFDGMVEIYFDSIENVRAMFGGNVPNIMRRDEENFVQMDAPALRVVTEEYVIAEKRRT